MVTLLSAHNLVRRVGSRAVLDGVSFSIEDGDRIGLIGRNGAGKSTLIRCLTGEDPPDDGHIIRKKDLSLGVVEQVPQLNLEHTVGDAVLDGLAHHQKLSQQLDQVEEAMAQTTDETTLEALVHQQAELGEALERLGGRAYHHRADAMLNALAAPPKDRSLSTLSLGERRRVALAVGLLTAPELLILDEPTNHLDVQTIEWLEQHLKTYAGSILLVTHDRHFLDKVTTRMAELDRGDLHIYEGSYTRFLEKKAEREAIAAKAESNRQRTIKSELEWVRRGPAARTTKSKARLQRFEALVDDAPKVALGEAEFRIPHPSRIGKNILELKSLSKSYGRKHLVQDLSLILTKGARIGIVGPNGAGKSTLLKMILGDVEPDKGSIVMGQNTITVYADQGRTDLNEENTILEEVGEGGDKVFVGERAVQVHSFLETLLFDPAQQRAKIGTLSGGERTRVALAKQLKKPGNLLILDEPTNDLDLATLRVLEEALVAYPGCVLVVSHDRWFLDRVTTAVLAFKGDGEVVLFEGGHADWRAHQSPSSAPASSASKEAPFSPTTVKSTRKRTRRTFKEQKEFDAIEDHIQNAEAKLEHDESELAQPETIRKLGPEIAKRLASLEEQKQLIETLYTRWEELSELEPYGGA